MRRYIKMGEKGDRFVGRVLALLDMMEPSFGVLPPHFVIESEDITSAAKACYPGIWEKGDNMKGILIMCLASVVYHARDEESYLRKNVPADHPLFNTFLFTEVGLLESLIPHVETGLFKCKKTGCAS